ncbi:MAG TPA: hypothetical protein VK786_02960 [bacterium]|jgi:hypothetical protein|nr:hypothetical protein [bacterium]
MDSRRRICTLMPCLLFCLLPWAARPLLAGEIPAAWQPGVAGDLAFETGNFLTRMAYAKPDRASKDLAEDGAYGAVDRAWDKAHRGKWYIEEQRYGFDAVAAGLAYQRQDLLDRAEKIYDWGFEQEGPDGGFPCGDAYHSASFFIEAVAHSALLIQASPMGPANQAWIRSMEPKLRLAVQWMMDPANQAAGRRRDAPYTHRDYLDAAALGESGILLGDAAMVARSKDYLEQGIARQDPSGFNPEKGGWDTSYHCVGLLFALGYYSLVADDATRAELRPMIVNGLNWLRGRMRPDGTVDQSGNTRTGLGQEKGRNGKFKTMSYGSAWRAAYYWAMISGDKSWVEVAKRLHHGQDVEKRQKRF